MIRGFTVILLLLSSRVLADEPRPAEVITAESERALALAQDGKLDEAVAIWVDILDEVPPQGRADVHVNLAVAYQGLARLPEAWYHLDATLTEAPVEDPAVAAERAAVEKKLNATHVPLRFSCEVPGTQLFLTVDRTQAYPCPLRWWFLRGDEGQIFADAPGCEPGATPIRAHELDRDRRVIVRLEPTPPEVPDEPDVPVVDKPPAASGAAWKWSLFGGGMGVVAAGAILQVMAFNKDQDLKKTWDPTDAATKDEFDAIAAGYSRRFTSDVKPLAYGAYALYGVGGAAAATGLVFLVMDWTRPEVDTSVHMAPIVASDILGFHLSLDF
ncbi:MAG: hypothetical protein ABIK09_09645 [Pseudomonadota bacterium]